jgi:hypothetical protein
MTSIPAIATLSPATIAAATVRAAVNADRLLAWMRAYLPTDQADALVEYACAAYAHGNGLLESTDDVDDEVAQ